MTTVFIDSGGFFAALTPEDRHHSRAQALLDEAEQGGWRLLTTNAVICETYTLLLSRGRRRHADALFFLDRIDSGFCVVEHVTAEDDRAAITLLRSHADKQFSYCDALSFVVMERLGIDQAIAFDQHFRQYGRFHVL